MKLPQFITRHFEPDKAIGHTLDSAGWKAEVDKGTRFLKSPFVNKSVKPERFQEAKQRFEAAYADQIKDIAETLPRGAVAPFLQHAFSTMEAIMERTFDVAGQNLHNDGQHTKKAHRAMIKEANSLAMEGFKAIKEKLYADDSVIQQSRQETHTGAPGTGVTIKPEVFITGDGKINLKRAAPLAESLVFRGGGAKGIGNAPGLTELEITGALRNVKHIVGTSAGALTALSLASGYDAERFAKLVDDNPMESISKSVDKFAEKYPMVKLEGVAGKGGIGKILRKHGGGTGERALQLCDQATASRVSEFLKGSWNTEAFQLKLVETKNTFGEEAVQRLALLKETPDFESDRSGKMITFKDLRILSQLAPETFRELTLTGQDSKNETTAYFNADHYPDMPVAVAGRISMSIPVFFQAVKFDPGDGGGRRSWVDGGLGSNMPSEVVMKGKQGVELENAQSKTLLFTYAEGDNWKDKLHGSEEFKASKLSNFIGSFIGNSRWGKSNKADNEKIHQGGINTFVVHHNDIGTTDLQADDLRVKMAQGQATLMMLKQIENRQGAQHTQTFDSVSDAIPYLSDEEKRMLVEAGPPDPGPNGERVNDKQYQAELQLYRLAGGSNPLRQARRDTDGLVGVAGGGDDVNVGRIDGGGDVNLGRIENVDGDNGIEAEIPNSPEEQLEIERLQHLAESGKLPNN